MPAAETAPNTPALQLVSQYLKDLSFENVRTGKLARRSFTPMSVELRTLVTVTELGDDLHESELFLGATGKVDDQPAFIAEMSYAVVYRISGLDIDMARHFLNVEAPRLAYPHAAALLTQASAGAGLPPLWLEPLDFSLLYNIRQQEAARAGAGAASGS